MTFYLTVNRNECIYFAKFEFCFLVFSCFSACHIQDFGIVNWYSWFKNLAIVDRGDELSIFQGIHVRFDIRIDISTSIRPMIPKFGKQVHL